MYQGHYYHVFTLRSGVFSGFEMYTQCGKNWQVAEGWQGAVMSSKVRMGIARHSGLLFILFLVVCIYKRGSQIIAQHYIVKWS